MKQLMSLCVMLTVLFVAPAAFACPSCALNDKAGLGSWYVLAGMLGTPFVITGIALVAMRKIGVLKQS